MTEFRGGAHHDFAIRMLEKERQKQRQEYEEKLNKLKKETETSLTPITSKFAGKSDSLEEQLKASTVGLVTLEDFRKKRIDLEVDATTALPSTTTSSSSTTNKATIPPAKKQKTKVDSSKLSFGFDDEENGEDGEEVKPIKKIKKNPYVETSFLPDKERDERERKEREEIAREWLAKQEQVKAELVDIMFTHFDGNGQFKVLKVKKGITIAQFIEKAKQEIKDLRGIGVDSLMFVKQNTIVPHHFSFYELFLLNASSKTGTPLFTFDDRETEEPNAAKIVNRKWYEANRHIYPASLWQVFEPKGEFKPSLLSRR